VTTPQVSGPARNVALELLRRSVAAAIVLFLILVILPALAQVAG
jgi:hypothetical protein